MKTMFEHELQALRALKEACARVYGAGLSTTFVDLAFKEARKASQERVFRYVMRILSVIVDDTQKPLDISYSAPHYHSTPESVRYIGFEHKAYVALKPNGSLFFEGFCDYDANGYDATKKHLCSTPLAGLDDAIKYVGWFALTERWAALLREFGYVFIAEALQYFSAGLAKL